MITAQVITERLDLIYPWYKGMVNETTGLLEYLYDPIEDTFSRERSPIRDIASVWDVEVLSSFLSRRDLESFVRRSIDHFSEYILKVDDYAILDPRRIGEPSSIAHSAFMMLALLYAPQPKRVDEIALLGEGILRQQRGDGSYKIYFSDLRDTGEEFYPGEAILALLEACRWIEDERYLRSAEQGVSYYRSDYFEAGRVSSDLLVFFANWQSQACRLLLQETKDSRLKQNVANYVFLLHDQIIEEGFYNEIERHPAYQSSVEVACALEGLNEAYAIAREHNDRRTDRYRRSICIALSYLLRLQRIENATEREKGGFGFSFTDRTQRIDVTGHVVSGFLKSVNNNIEC